MLSNSIIQQLDNLQDLIEEIKRLDEKCNTCSNEKYILHLTKFDYLHFDDEEKKLLKECQENFSALYKKRLADKMQIFLNSVDCNKLR